MIDLLWNVHTSTSIFCPLKCWLSLYTVYGFTVDGWTEKLDRDSKAWQIISIQSATFGIPAAATAIRKHYSVKIYIHNEGITEQRHFQTHRFHCFHLVRLPTEWITEKISRHNESGIHSMHAHIHAHGHSRESDSIYALRWIESNRETIEWIAMKVMNSIRPIQIILRLQYAYHT